MTPPQATSSATSSPQSSAGAGVAPPGGRSPHLHEGLARKPPLWGGPGLILPGRGAALQCIQAARGAAQGRAPLPAQGARPRVPPPLEMPNKGSANAQPCFCNRGGGHQEGHRHHLPRLWGRGQAEDRGQHFQAGMTTAATPGWKTSRCLLRLTAITDLSAWLQSPWPCQAGARAERGEH